MTPGRRLLVLQFAATLGTALTTARQLTPAHLGAEWPYYAADAAATHYSALERITRGGRVSPQAALGVASRGVELSEYAPGRDRSRTHR
jgi:hypothetical protein